MNKLYVLYICVCFFSSCNSDFRKRDEVKLCKADSLSAHKKYEEALPLYKEIYEGDSLKLEAVYGYALSNLKLGNNMQAIFYFNKYLAKVNNVDAYGYRGVAYDNLDSFHQALRDYSMAILLDSSIASMYNNRGLIKIKLKLYKESMMDFRSSLKLDSNCSECFDNIGIAYENLNNYQTALDCYAKAISLDPKSGIYYFNSGVCYIKAEQYEKAIEFLNKAILIEPTNGLFYKNRAIAFYRLKDLNKTCEDLNKAVQFNDESSKEYLDKFCNKDKVQKVI